MRQKKIRGCELQDYTKYLFTKQLFLCSLLNRFWGGDFGALTFGRFLATKQCRAGQKRPQGRRLRVE